MKISIFKRVVAILMVMLCYLQAKPQEFKAKQFSQTASIILNGNIEKVFPLFGALEEKKWAADWRPEPVFPASGNMEEGFIFQSPDHLPNWPLLTWVVAKFDPEVHQLKYIITSANRVIIISVSCAPSNVNHTEAKITYQFTGLTEEGNEISQHLIINLFKHNLKDWETAINSYLDKLD